MRSKKLFSAVTALALAVSMVTMPLTDQRVPLPDTAVTAHAESNVFSGFEYTEMYGSIWITGYQGEKKNVTIPNTIEGKNVTTISRYAFAGNEDITSISLPSNIINIQDGAFLGCTNLTNFSCTGNKSFEFRGGVLYFKRETETQISMSGITSPPIKTTKVAFFCAKDSTSINVPDGVDGIADYAFMNRSKLEHIVLPSGITYIGEKAFYGCSSLKTMSATDGTDNSSEFNIPYGTIYIGDYAFMDCSEIHSLNLPDTLWAIEDACFLNCTGLKSVFVPDSVKYIGNCAFGYTGSETTRMRRGDFTLYSKVEMNEDGETEPNAASDYAADNAITFADPDQYQGSTVDEDGNRSYTNSDGYAVNLYQNVTHDPNKDFDHVYIYSAVVAPTCTTPGAIAGICYCGHTFYQQFDPLGHAYLPTVVAPTCTEQGYTANICVRCGEILENDLIGKRDFTEPTGHTYVDYETEATYDHEGYIEHVCEGCGASYIDNIVPKLHDPNDSSADDSIPDDSSSQTDDHSSKSDDSSSQPDSSSTPDSSSKPDDSSTPDKPAPTPTPTKTPISKATVTVSNKTYTGKALKPAPTVKLSGKTLKKGTDYTVSYKNNTSCGKATVTVTGKGSYTGTKTGSFIIKPKAVAAKKLTSPKSKQIKLTWTKAAGGVTGYEVQIATNKAFSKGKKSYTVAKAATVSKTVTKLKKGTKYYARVRAYKTVGKTKYYGAWSAIKSVKCK